MFSQMTLRNLENSVSRCFKWFQLISYLQLKCDFVHLRVEPPCRALSNGRTKIWVLPDFAQRAMCSEPGISSNWVQCSIVPKLSPMLIKPQRKRFLDKNLAYSLTNFVLKTKPFGLAWNNLQLLTLHVWVWARKQSWLLSPLKKIEVLFWDPTKFSNFLTEKGTDCSASTANTEI